MTTYQDPPLHSRRAARQGERNAAYGQQHDAEPLTYSTQTRPPVPQYGGPDFRARRTPEPSAEAEASTPLTPEQQPAFRVRDYSPEGRRAASPSPQPEWQTSRADAAPSPIEHTMTRRELRALREAQGLQSGAAGTAAPSQPAPSSFAPQPVAPQPVAPQPASTPSASSLAAFAPAAEPSAPELSPFEALFAGSAQQAVQNFAPDPIAPAPAPQAEPPAAEVVAPERAAAPATPSVRTGHWTTQADLDDATQVNESTISRKVGAGSGAITTSALVLPAMPNPEFTKLGTGEVLVTGSIDLPHSLATSGAHPQQLDEQHLDHELDPGDHQIVSTDSQPVRAVRAVSSHTSTRNVIAAKKPAGNRGLTALIVSAAAMAAVVVTLLVVGLVTNVL